MLTLRRSQIALLGAAMLERFIDEEAARLAAQWPALQAQGLRESVRLAVQAARSDGLHSVSQVRARLDEVFGAAAQAATG